MSCNKNTIEINAYMYIRDNILAGNLNPGERIIENEIAEIVGISRTPVREALSRLEQEGYLTKASYRGYKVKKFSYEEIKETYQIRSALEGLAAYLTALSVNEKGKEELQDIYMRAERKLQEDNLKALADLNDTFHDMLLEKSGNKMLKENMLKLRSFISILRLSVWTIPSRPAETMQEHKNIMEAIFEGDAFKSQKMAFLHVNNSWEVARTVIKRPES